MSSTARATSRAPIGIRHETITTAELEREGYRANGRDRCYHCKSELYDQLAGVAERRRFAAVLSGANADDIGDWRPGLTAAAEHGVLHPLLEAGVGKEEVRRLARQLGVPSAEKPASPCLASRIPYGTEVDPAVLAQIDRAEIAVKALGYPVLRVRHYGMLGRVELAADELGALTADRREAIVAAVVAAGYADVEIADEPFRSGSLNASFTKRLAVATLGDAGERSGDLRLVRAAVSRVRETPRSPRAGRGDAASRPSSAARGRRRRSARTASEAVRASGRPRPPGTSAGARRPSSSP